MPHKKKTKSFSEISKVLSHKLDSYNFSKPEQKPIKNKE